MKINRLFSIAAATMMMVACSSEDTALKNTPAAGPQMQFTATIAAPGSGATTRTEYTEVTTGEAAGTISVAWKENDKIALIHNGVKDVATVKTVNADGSATITGFITKANNGDGVEVCYPAELWDWDDNTKGAIRNATFVTNIGAQGGTLNYIQENLDVRMAKGELKVDGDNATLSASVKPASQIAIWKLTLQDDAETPAALSATQVTVKVDGTTPVTIAGTTTLGTATSTVYLAMDAITNENLTIEATVGEATYSCTNEGVTLARGKYYQSTVTMAPQGYAANEYNEGSWDETGKKVVFTKKTAASDPTAVTSSTSVTWSAGWYTVSGDVTINGNVTLGANTDLILQDGATLTINGRLICSTPLHSYNLNIYGQEAGTGKLNISNNADAIYSSGTYYIKIHGGEITAQSTSKSGIRGGIIEMYAGKLTATTNNNMGNAAISYPNGDFIVYGGEVTAENITTSTGTDNPALSNANTTSALKVFGGKVKATGGNGSKGIKGNIMSGTSGIKFYFSDNGTDWDAGTGYGTATTSPTNRYVKAE